MTRHHDRACPVVLACALAFGAGFAVATGVLIGWYCWVGVRGHK